MSRARLMAQAGIAGLGLAALWAGVWWACDHTVVGELALRAVASVA